MPWLRSTLLASLVLASACTSPAATCGEGTDPVVIVGLTGLLDGDPAVEIIDRVPETCESLDRRWMFFDPSARELTVGPEPSEGVLTRDGVDVEPDGFFFVAAEVGVRIVYPGEVEAGEVSFEWYSATEELGAVDCADDAGSLSCAVRP